jgi:hypothetical protein
LVVTPILPDVAPVGTLVVTSISETTVKLADFPLNDTFVVWVSPVPLIVTNVPTGPLGGENDVCVGLTLKVCEG